MWWIFVIFGIISRVKGACEPIRIEMCRGLGYNVTTMPNLVGHEMQEDADSILQTFSPLIQYGCSAQLHLFLCSVHAPMCTEKVPSPIGPCRKLCEQVKARCFPVLQGFGFPWPADLNCSKFPPENNHQHMCMEGPGEPGPANPVQPIGSGNGGGPWGCSWYAKSGLYIFLNRSGRCAAACDADILWSQKDKKVTEGWIAVFLGVSLLSIFIASLTLLRQPKKQSIHGFTAERPLAFLTLCHAAVSLGYVIRLIAGRATVACSPPLHIHPQDQILMGQQQQYLTQDGLGNPYCATIFLLLYYFGNVATVWWVVICAWWSIVVRKWTKSTLKSGEEEIGLQQSFAALSSIVAWGVPAVFTVAVLVTRDVDSDELTGNCYVGQQNARSLLLLVLLPHVSYFAFGTLFLLIGTASLLLHRPSRAPPSSSIPVPTSVPITSTRPLRGGRDAKQQINTRYRHGQSIRRLGCFAWFYAVLLCFWISSIFYEWFSRDTWLKAPEPSSTPKQSTRPILQVFLCRILILFFQGLASSCWIWWPNFRKLWTKIPPLKQPPKKIQNQVSMVHCYGDGSAHQGQNFGNLTGLGNLGSVGSVGVRNPLLIHQGIGRGHKKRRKSRKYRWGSETQV